MLHFSVSVVVPVYNSTASLHELADRIDKTMSTLTSQYELILINDGSIDNSWEIIQALARKYTHIKGINLMRNYGQGNALLCGIRTAKYEVIITLDDDLQHPPEEIPKLIQKLDHQTEVVFGATSNVSHGFARQISSRITKLLLKNLMGVGAVERSGPFRAFYTYLRDGFKDFNGNYVSIDVLLTWTTKRFALVEVNHMPRKHGDSGYSLFKLVTHSLNLITGFSVLPLQFAGLIGLTFTLVGIVVLGFILIRYVFSGSVVPGFAFLASIVAIFSGAQLLVLGIIGEYLARLYMRIMSKPSYTIKDIYEPAHIS